MEPRAVGKPAKCSFRRRDRTWALGLEEGEAGPISAPPVSHANTRAPRSSWARPQPCLWQRGSPAPSALCPRRLRLPSRSSLRPEAGLLPLGLGLSRYACAARSRDSPSQRAPRRGQLTGLVTREESGGWRAGPGLPLSPVRARCLWRSRRRPLPARAASRECTAVPPGTASACARCRPSTASCQFGRSAPGAAGSSPPRLVPRVVAAAPRER